MINLPYKIVAFFKYLKPKTITYCLYPQTVKSSSVTVAAEPDENGLYLGSDGNKYVRKIVDCRKSVTLSDKKKYVKGAEAYFKVEPVVWQKGGACYTRIDIKDKHGNLKKIKHKKTGQTYFTAKYVLNAQKKTFSDVGKPYGELLISEEEEARLGKHSIKAEGIYANLGAAFSTDWNIQHSARRNFARKATDYAIASGVTVKGRRAYHTLMSNDMCCAPNGKCKDIPKKAVTGEVLTLTVEAEKMIAKEE